LEDKILKLRNILLVIVLLLVSLTLAAFAPNPVQTTQPPAAFDWSGLLSTCIQAVALVALPLLAKYAVSWMTAQREYLEKQARAYAPDEMDILIEAARMAVGAAEQSKLAGLVEDKKQYAIGVVEQWLSTKGFVVDLHLIEAEIERQVGLQFPKPVNLPTPEGASPAEQAQR
jgi:hypothetical protein